MKTLSKKTSETVKIFYSTLEGDACMYLKKSEIESVTIKTRVVDNPDYDGETNSQTSEPGKLDAYYIEVRTKSGGVIVDDMNYFEKEDAVAVVDDALDIE